MEITPAIRAVLSARSVKDKIGIAIDCDLAPVGELAVVSELVREGMLVWIDRTVLSHQAVVDRNDPTPRPPVRHPNVDVYQLTPKGVEFCEQHGIKQR